MSTNNITCANCGKGEEISGDLKACTACKMVKYCNRECQIAHRPQHKKLCKKRAVELYDEKLFKETPREECPICMLTLPLYETHQTTTGVTFHSCCGKRICHGCICAMAESGVKDLCAYCRTPPENSDEEIIKRVEKLMERGNPNAFNHFAGYYEDGTMGLPQNQAKANELYLKAGELGCATAYYNLGNAYRLGRGVEVEAKHCYELAAMNGHVIARHNLGGLEGQTGNFKRAMKHLLISARAGCKKSLDLVMGGYKDGFVTKEEYANALRECQKSQDEMKSDARDKAVIILND